MPNLRLYNLSEASKTKKEVYNKTTKEMEFATDSEIDKSGGNLVPKLQINRQSHQFILTTKP